MYVCMYVSMYVVIRRPCAHHAVAHVQAQILAKREGILDLCKFTSGNQVNTLW